MIKETIMINKVQKNRLMTLAFLLILHSSLFTLHSSAQMRFGYLSYSEVLQAMPDYATVKSNVAKLQGQFEDEMKRAEEEFNKKYEEFLEGQHEFAVSIRNKRQSELQDLMEKNMAFKQEARRLLKNAEADAMKPLHEKLKAALAKVGQQRGLAFILNTDGDALPYVDPAQGEDVTEIIKRELSR
jgi:outer membrane protein